MERNQSFATMKLLGDIDFKLFINKEDSEEKFLALPPTYPAQEISTGKPALGRQPWFDHFKNMHPGFTQEDPELLVRYPPHSPNSPHPIVSEQELSVSCPSLLLKPNTSFPHLLFLLPKIVPKYPMLPRCIWNFHTYGIPVAHKLNIWLFAVNLFLLI